AVSRRAFAVKRFPSGGASTSMLACTAAWRIERRAKTPERDEDETVRRRAGPRAVFLLRGDQQVRGTHCGSGEARRTGNEREQPPGGFEGLRVGAVLGRCASRPRVGGCEAAVRALTPLEPVDSAAERRARCRLVDRAQSGERTPGRVKGVSSFGI